MKKNLYLSIVCMVATSALLSACGGSSAKSSADNYEYAYAAEEAAYEEYEEAYYDDDVYAYSGSSADYTNGSDGTEVASDEQLMASSNRKLIRTVNLSVETREFDALIENVQSKIKQLGGYAESSNISGNSYSKTGSRNAYIVARIPQDKLDSFVTVIESSTNITSKSENAEDVTLSYADVQARKDSLRVEQERLNELLEQADSLETIIALQSRLTEVRYEIESYESRLRTMDNQVTYSTVYLDINEVKEYKPEPVEDPTFAERLSEAFLDNCESAFETIQDFFIGFISFLPILLVLIIIFGIIGLIIFGIVKLFIFVIKKIMAKKQAVQPKNQVVATIVTEKVNTEEGKEKVFEDKAKDTVFDGENGSAEATVIGAVLPVEENINNADDVNATKTVEQNKQ